MRCMAETCVNRQGLETGREASMNPEDMQEKAARLFGARLH